MKIVRFGTLRPFTRLGLTAVTCAAVLLSLAAVSPAARAQIVPTTQQVYAAKFVCGFRPGFTPPQENVINGPGIYDYRDFEPGSYATAINVFFPGGLFFLPTVEAFVSVPETAANPPVTGIALGPLSVLNSGSVKIDCESIIAAIDSQTSNTFSQIPDLEVVEGFVYIPRAEDDLVVEAVYTYSSQIGALGGEPVNPVGIGAGASVHVQNIQAKSVSVFTLF